MEIIPYKSDSGSRDLGIEKSFSRDIPFHEILRIANELKAPLIVKTSYVNEKKPGAWYVKGYIMPRKGVQLFTYDEIKNKILLNVELKKHTRRECYLIKYI